MHAFCVYRGEYHTSEYVAACRMVAEGEGLVVRARNTMCEWREKAPLQVSWSGVGVCGVHSLGKD